MQELRALSYNTLTSKNGKNLLYLLHSYILLVLLLNKVTIVVPMNPALLQLLQVALYWKGRLWN